MTGLRATFTKKFPGGAGIVLPDLRVDAGVSVLFGPSGSGKTTLLRCLAGLERPDDGEISFGNEIWFSRAQRIYRPPEQRQIGYVPQDYGLFRILLWLGMWPTVWLVWRRPRNGNEWRRRWIGCIYRRRPAACRDCFPVANSSGWPWLGLW